MNIASSGYSQNRSASASPKRRMMSSERRRIRTGHRGLPWRCSDCFTHGFVGHPKGDFFVFGDFVQVLMEHLEAHCVVLHLLNQRQALGLGIAFDGQVQKHDFRVGGLDDVLEFFERNLKFLGRALAAVNDGGNAPGSPHLFRSDPPAGRSRRSTIDPTPPCCTGLRR